MDFNLQVERLHVVIDVDIISIFKSFLEEDNIIGKSSFHRHHELSKWKPCLYACFVPFFLFILDFLIQSMVFCKVDYTYFNNTSSMPTQNLMSFVVYWHVFDIIWPK
jgi:hypothetical protein